MTQYETKSIAVADPRTFDGDPFTVAARAAAQVAALIELSAAQAEIANMMHRNSFMEAILQAGDELSPSAWDNSPYRNKWQDVEHDLKALQRKVEALGAAAGYDPKHPPKP